MRIVMTARARGPGCGSSRATRRPGAWVMRLAGLGMCVWLSACASGRIDGLGIGELDAALAADQAGLGAARAICPTLAGDYAVQGVVLDSHGDWALTDADLVALLTRMGWSDPIDTHATAQAAPVAWLRIADAGAAAPASLQGLSPSGGPADAPIVLQTPVVPDGRSVRSVACLDQRLLLRSARHAWLSGETGVHETWTVVIRRVAPGIEVSVLRQRVTRGGLLFTMTTRDRANSRFLFADRDVSPAALPTSR